MVSQEERDLRNRRDCLKNGIGHIQYYFLDTDWGCGLIIVKESVVIDSAPIFRKLIGKSLKTLARGGYKISKIEMI